MIQAKSIYNILHIVMYFKRERDQFNGPQPIPIIMVSK
jgi:hypothetical protein